LYLITLIISTIINQKIYNAMVNFPLLSSTPFTYLIELLEYFSI
jgi:hypothetical protein